MNELVSRVVRKPWPKGVSGNPSGLPGRPAGSRQTFSAGFLDDLAKTWRDKGRQTMEWTAENQPSTFFAVCARLRPRGQTNNRAAAPRQSLADRLESRSGARGAGYR